VQVQLRDYRGATRTITIDHVRTMRRALTLLVGDAPTLTGLEQRRASGPTRRTGPHS
jgi:hypothetical protein